MVIVVRLVLLHLDILSIDIRAVVDTNIVINPMLILGVSLLYNQLLKLKGLEVLRIILMIVLEIIDVLVNLYVVLMT